MPLPSHLGLYWEIPTIVFTPATAPTPNYGSGYTFRATIDGGTSPYTITLDSGSLPTGLSFTAGTNYFTITGTPTAYGAYTFTVKAVDYNGYVGTQTYSFSVGTPVITILPNTLPNATAPASYSTTFTASGGVGPYTFTVLSGSLPTGLSLSTSGVLSGVAGGADAAVTYNFVLRAVDSASAVGTQSYTVTINPRDRAVARPPPTVLIVYDMNEGLFWWPVGAGYYAPQYYAGYSYTGSDVYPSVIAQSVAGRESSLGFITRVVTSYAELNSLSRDDMNKFSHIWDVGYHTAPSDSAKAKYVQYLQDGGALFLLGENAYFLQRDLWVCDVINTAGGGGSVTVRNDVSGLDKFVETVANEFLLANTRSDVTFYAPNYFTNYGTATPIASGPYGVSAAVWKTGSLSNARAGAIVSVLDINFIVNPAYGANNNGAQWQPWFVDNVSIVLNKK
jgi:hypothetical protein